MFKNPKVLASAADQTTGDAGDCGSQGKKK